jgi:hypothetical protein
MTVSLKIRLLTITTLHEILADDIVEEVLEVFRSQAALQDTVATV